MAPKEEESSDYTPSNILVTGGAGFIASAFVLRIIEKYPAYKIVVLDKLDYCASRKHLEHLERLRNFKFVKGDVQESDLLNYLLESEKIDTILHFAAQTHVDNSFGNSVIFTTNNVLGEKARVRARARSRVRLRPRLTCRRAGRSPLARVSIGTHSLLEAAKRAMPRLKRFVHVSTDEVYGENPGQGDEKFDETSKMEPTNPYAATKASAEMLCTGYWHSYKLPLIVTRGNNVYGPRQYPEKLIPKMINLALRGMPLWIHGNGQQRRSYLHVDDVAAAFDVIMHKGTLGERYNIGTTVDRTVLDVVQTIASELNVPKTQIKHVEDRVFNDQRYYMDSSKLLQLGWKEEQNWDQARASRRRRQRARRARSPPFPGATHAPRAPPRQPSRHPPSLCVRPRAA
jgi:UDP-glucose 4,6-dehydratase